jgi:hypothetical protein
MCAIREMNRQLGALKKELKRIKNPHKTLFGKAKTHGPGGAGTGEAGAPPLDKAQLDGV